MKETTFYKIKIVKRKDKEEEFYLCHIDSGRWDISKRVNNKEELLKLLNEEIVIHFKKEDN